MLTYGIDFGTTNTRVARWDPEGQSNPEILAIGLAGDYTMPSVAAFVHNADDTVSIELGEDADQRGESSGEVIVVRNIKRWALASDPSVGQGIERLGIPRPPWWDEESRSIRAFGQEFPAEQVIGAILEEALRRATESVMVAGGAFDYPSSRGPGTRVPEPRTARGRRCVLPRFIRGIISRLLQDHTVLPPPAQHTEPSLDAAQAIGSISQPQLQLSGQWRASAPVTSGLDFREILRDAIAQTLPGGRISWISMEPVLVLALLYRQGRLGRGTYMIYDWGGGSFDCALAEVESEPTGLRLTVYAAAGDPLLGGMDIDRQIAALLNYEGPPYSLRIAKELLSATGEPQTLPGGIRLDQDHIRAILDKAGYFDRTLYTTLEAYRQAKRFWKRPSSAPPVGEILSQEEGVVRRSVQDLKADDLAADIDRIILIGGSTRIPYIRARLEQLFGRDKVASVAELALAYVRNAELTALAIGSCYSVTGIIHPLYSTRLPVSIDLEIEHVGHRYHSPYRAFDHLQEGGSLKPHLTLPVRLSLSDKFHGPRYNVTITDADGEALTMPGAALLAGSFGTGTRRLRLAIDPFGRVAIEVKPISGPPWLKPVVDDPPWQTNAQRNALKRVEEERTRYEIAVHSGAVANITQNPWGWGTH